MSNIPLDEIYQTLRARFGHRGWWPGTTKLEIILGAILTQNTNWRNVEKALANLRGARMMSLRALRAIPADSLAELIRPSGYYNQKALKIKAFVLFLEDNYKGSLARMFREDTPTLREKLLGVKGIGRETADSILLYAGGHLSFVADLYTWRVMTRHNWAPEDIDYEGLRELFESRLPRDLDLWKDYHAQLVAVGNRHCRKTPKCDECPLKPYLPG